MLIFHSSVSYETILYLPQEIAICSYKQPSHPIWRQHIQCMGILEIGEETRSNFITPKAFPEQCPVKLIHTIAFKPF